MARSPGFRREETAEGHWNASLCLRLALLFSLAGALPAAADEPAQPPALPPRPVGEVTVTATRAERDVLDVPGHVTVIDREAIDHSGVRDLPDLLRREAGLFVTNFTTNPAGTTIEARGFNNGGALGSSLLVLVDGRRVNEADTGATDWALLPLDAVERIEIVRGPASAVWGDNAVGGVIQIVTRRPEGPPQLTLRGTAGTWDSGRGSLTASGSLGPAGFSLFAESATTEGYRDGADFRTPEHLQGRIAVDLGERIRVGLSGGYASDRREFPGSLTRQELAVDRRARQPGTLEDSSIVRSRFLQGFIEVALDDIALLRIEPHHSARSDQATITSVFGTTLLDFEKDSSGVHAQLRLDVPLGPLPNRFTLGGEFLREDTDRDISGAFAQITRSRRYVYGVYLQNELELSEHLLFTLGSRFDRARLKLETRGQAIARPEFDVWSPKAALTWRVADPLSVYVSYSRGFRLPNFDEDAPIFPGAEPTLVPQKSNSYEVGVKLESERLRGTAALYQMNVRDEIVFDPTAPPFGTNVNFDRVRHRGLELTLQAQLLEWLELRGNYSFEDVEIRKHSNPAFEGERMPITPRHRGAVGLLAHLPFWLEAGVDARYVGSRRLSNDFANRLRKMDKYAVYDAQLAFRPPLGEHVEAGLVFVVRNLFDREYDEFGADFSPFSPARFNPAPTRSYEVGLMLTLRP